MKQSVDAGSVCPSAFMSPSITFSLSTSRCGANGAFGGKSAVLQMGSKRDCVHLILETLYGVV